MKMFKGLKGWKLYAVGTGLVFVVIGTGYGLYSLYKSYTEVA